MLQAGLDVLRVKVNNLNTCRIGSFKESTISYDLSAATCTSSGILGIKASSNSASCFSKV